MASVVAFALEFVRPGLVLPGLLGAAGIITASVNLTSFPLSPAAVSIAALTVCCGLSSAFTPHWRPLAGTAAVLSAVAAHLLVLPPFTIPWWPAAILTAPVIFGCCWLLAIAGQGWRNKRAG